MIKDLLVVLAAAVTASAALVVPYLVYRFTLNLEHRRWLREQRLETYIDTLNLIRSALDRHLGSGSPASELTEIRHMINKLYLLGSDQARKEVGWFVNQYPAGSSSEEAAEYTRERLYRITEIMRDELVQPQPALTTRK